MRPPRLYAPMYVTCLYTNNVVIFYNALYGSLGGDIYYKIRELGAYYNNVPTNNKSMYYLISSNWNNIVKCHLRSLPLVRVSDKIKIKQILLFFLLKIWEYSQLKWLIELLKTRDYDF